MGNHEHEDARAEIFVQGHLPSTPGSPPPDREASNTISKATLGARIAALPFDKRRDTATQRPSTSAHGHENPQVQGHVGGLVVAPRERLPPVALDRRAASLGTAHLAVPVGLGNGVVPVAHDTVRATGYRTSSLRRQGMQHPNPAQAQTPPPPRRPERRQRRADGQQPLSRRAFAPATSLASLRTRIHRVPFTASFPSQGEKSRKLRGLRLFEGRATLVPEQPIRRPSP